MNQTEWEEPEPKVVKIQVSRTQTMIPKRKKAATSSVITVGDGRGFVVNGPARGKYRHRLVLTAAHCLPFFPPCHGASYTDERTYGKLLSQLGSEPSIMAECLFADPIADIAILGSPDNQELGEEAEAYENLVESTHPISIAEAPRHGYGWLLSLDCCWFRCTVSYTDDSGLWISEPSQPIAGGMSGSPIVSEDGAAIGIVTLGGSSFGNLNVRLFRSLPAWGLRGIQSVQA